MSPGLSETSLFGQSAPICEKALERKDGKIGACGAAGHIEEKSFAEADEAASGTSFPLFPMPALCELTDSFCKLKSL